MSYRVPVNLIRQWCYCPRIVYYIELTSFPVSYPSWVKQGEKFHQNEAKLWQRRNLSRFGLEKGIIHLNRSMASSFHKIHGIADMIIETDGEVYPVEFKLDKYRKKRGGILQLAAYGLLAGEFFKKKCTKGFLTEGKKIINEINFTQKLFSELLQKVTDINQMIEAGVKPDSSASMYQCTICEYLNHCNDRG